MSLHIHLVQKELVSLHVDVHSSPLHKSYEVHSQGNHEAGCHICTSQDLMSSLSGCPVRCLTVLVALR